MLPWQRKTGSQRRLTRRVSLVIAARGFGSVQQGYIEACAQCYTFQLVITSENVHIRVIGQAVFMAEFAVVGHKG